ncbi:acyl-CoA dehydrogenase family protein [Mycobacterium camsae]|uniref:acyl-CoA dehydrogenase family protein n=1 Tax=Mycobacterium gordonae TaxID=1778 RepID=UPI0019815FB0|nr:acyl-CoA dehydrogenase family protein [Mycobacterium gordonae]
MTTIDTSQPTRKPLSASDFLAIDLGLSEDERLIRDTVRYFVRRDMLERLPEAYAAGRLPDGFPAAAGDLGLLGMHLRGYGCAGTNAVSYGLACMELEAGDSGLRSFVSVQGSLAMFAIWRFGSESQKQMWLPVMARGSAIGCFGLTEPDAGSDPAGMRTTARFEDGQWVLNGTKMWITNGDIADVAVVWARDSDCIRGFVVPRGTPGFVSREIQHKMSLRASTTGELVFDNCRLPAEALLPGAEGLRAPLACLNEARFGIAWGAVGAARACYETALDYAASRTQFGSPIAGFQLTQAKLVDMLTQVNNSYLLAMHLGRLKDAGQLHPEQVSYGKRHNVQQALDVCRTARTILGANGITLEYPVMRHMANLESVLTYEGTGEIHTLIVGHAITGIPAFR